MFYWLLVGTLCVWRFTHLLQAEDGPWDIIVRLRKAAGEGFWGSLLDCFACLSLWIAAPFAIALGQTLVEKLLLWPALSAGAIALERATNPELRYPPASYLEADENDNGMLRQQETRTPRNSPDVPGE